MPLLNKCPRTLFFIEEIRALSENDDAEFNEKLQALLLQKSLDVDFKTEFTQLCYFTLDNAFFVNAFADYGILSNRGLFPEIYLRFKHKFLPVNADKDELHHFLNFLFSEQTDYLWIQKINFSSWEAISKLIDANQLVSHSDKVAAQLYNAIIILCHRLTSIGIDPYIVNKLPKFDDSDSPFFELNLKASLFLKNNLYN